MKKMITLVLTAAVALGVGNFAMAENSKLPIADVGEACLDENHTHAEDIVVEPIDRSQLVRAEVHCDNGSSVGKLIVKTTKNNLGSETRNCAHGGVGKLDRRYKYQEVTKYSCTVCKYTDTKTGTAYWASWDCLK